MGQSIGFLSFSVEELKTGIAYAKEKHGEDLLTDTLSKAGNHAGAIVKETGLSPGNAMTFTLQKFLLDNNLEMKPARFKAYIAAFAKMLSERSVRARRAHAPREVLPRRRAAAKSSRRQGDTAKKGPLLFELEASGQYCIKL